MKTSKTIVITGATAGIGRHAALHLARHGHHVIATGRNAGALAKLKAEANGARLDIAQLDVTDGKSIAAAVLEVERLSDGRGADVLVNNAGYGQAGALEELSDADLRAQFETNVFGLMAVTRAFLPSLRRHADARIINVSSVGGRVTFPMFGAYHASKYALEALSDALRRELGAFGIAVSLIEPGPIRSQFSDRAFSGIVDYRGAASKYAAVYARADKIQAMTDAQSFGPEVVSRDIEHAAVSRRPRARYVSPRRMAIVLSFLNAMPTRLTDWVMMRILGLTAKGLAATSTTSQSLAIEQRPAA